LLDNDQIRYRCKSEKLCEPDLSDIRNAETRVGIASVLSRGQGKYKMILDLTGDRVHVEVRG
jgi:hypothetical protein